MQKSNLIIALIFLITGFFIAQFFDFETQERSLSLSNDSASHQTERNVSNPFQTEQSQSDITATIGSASVSDEITNINRRLSQIEQTLKNLNNLNANPTLLSKQQSNSRPYIPSLNRRLYNIKTLIRGGIEPGLAEDIVRRKNSFELKRLELQDHAKRDGYFNTQRYHDELEQINLQDITLKEELGEQPYDQYLYDSKQNNRIRISSVMLGSKAEQAGIENGDIVLSYDNNRMFSWQELKNATTEGELGEYVSISIYRKGEIFSFSVPRGPLGMQLGATRLEP